MDLLDKLDARPIIGEHKLGALHIECTQRHWKVYDDHGNRWAGTARNGRSMREHVRASVKAWLWKTRHDQ